MPRRLLLSAVSALLAVFVYLVPNQRYPNSADDWSYLFQARLLASGHAYAEDALYDKANPLQRYVGTNCVTDYHGRRFSKYPPGWPLLLSVGSAAGVEWLVGPLLGALLVFLVLLDVERRAGREWVVRAWVLIALCAFFSYTFQSFRSHTATMLCLFGAFLVYDRTRNEAEHGAWRVFASGALVGYVSLIRYVDWIPLALWIAWDLLRRKRLAHAALCAAGFGLIASGNLLYDVLLSGDAFATPTALNGALSPHDHLVLSWRGFLVTGVRLTAVAYAFPPVMVLAVWWHRRRAPGLKTGGPTEEVSKSSKPQAAVTGVKTGGPTQEASATSKPQPDETGIALKFRPSEVRKSGAPTSDCRTVELSDESGRAPAVSRIYVWLFLMSVAVYFFYVGAIGGPGPRYLASYFPFLVVATVGAWRGLHAEDAGRAHRLWRNAIVAQVACSLVFAAIEIRRVEGRKDLDRAVARLEGGRKIVILKTGPRAETWADFTRNPPSLASADVLYFGWGDGAGLDRLIERFPGRRVYVYEYPDVIYPRRAR